MSESTRNSALHIVLSRKHLSKLRMHLKRLFLIVHFFVSLLTASAQDPVNGIMDTYNINCHSPEVQSLTRYGQIPVNLHTGTADINIPLFEADIHGIKFDISASYNTSGIKVDDIASCLGLGWVLNIGGVISRSVNGIADETKQQGWLNHTLTQRELTYDYYRRDMYNTTHALAIDCAADDFTFNFFGHKGSFVFNSDGTPYQLPFSNLKIEFVDQDYFRITDEHGNVFTFKDKESTILNSNGKTVATSAWYLSEVKLANNRGTISFSYIDGASYEDRFPIYSSTIVKQIKVSGDYTRYTRFVNGISGTQISYRYVQTSTKWLKEVRFLQGRLGRVILDYDEESRKDFRGGKALRSLKVYNSSDSLAKPIRDWRFAQRYDLCKEGRKGNLQYECDTYRMFLVSMSDVADSANVETFSMTYDPTPLPCRKSFGKDLWGYYNGKYYQENSIYVRSLDSATVKKLNFPKDVYNNRKGSEQHAKAGSLTSITYPTGGCTRIEYEAHRTPEEGIGGGLRVKSIKNYSGEQCVESHDYKYGLNEDGFGEISAFNYNKNFKNIDGGYYYSLGSDEKTDDAKYIIYTLTDNPFYPSYVAYEQVTEYVGDASGQQGKTVNDFHIYMDGLADSYDTYPHPMYFESHAWQSGYPTCIRTYENHNGAQRLVRSESYNHRRFDLVRFGTYCVNTRYLYDGDMGLAKGDVLTNVHAEELYFTTFIPKETGTVKPIGCTTTDFFYNGDHCDSLTTITRFTYDGLKGSTRMHDCITEKREARAGTPWRSTQMRYLYDIVTNTDTIPAIYARMLHNNLGTTPMEVIQRYGDDAIGAQVYLYQSFPNNIIVPHKQLTLETTKPLNDYNTLHFRSGQLVTDERLGLCTTFTKFDVKGNIKEFMERDSIPVSIIWGYGWNLPIVKAKGVSATDLLPAYGLLNESAVCNSSRPPIGKLHEYLKAKFRGKPVEIEMFAHEPLVGLKSKYSINGELSTYEFDTKGRLIEEKDYRGATVRHYKYNIVKPK